MPYFHTVFVKIYYYKMKAKTLQLQHLDKKMAMWAVVQNGVHPPAGWLRAIRTTIGMSMEQLGRKLSVTKQSVADIERREKDESITLRSLREAAEALDMQLVYGLVPKDGSLNALIERKATELATKIVLRASNTMKLEDQGNTKERIHKAIQERTAIIMQEMPKVLWD